MSQSCFKNSGPFDLFQYSFCTKLLRKDLIKFAILIHFNIFINCRVVFSGKKYILQCSAFVKMKLKTIQNQN